MNHENLGKGTVLIADDDDDSRELLSFLLMEEGWQVREARDGKEALEAVMKCKPDVLILDNRMPELTGIEVYKQIKLQGINLVVVLATAYGYLEELALSVGISYYITKPYDIPLLLSTIEAAYANSGKSV